MRINKKDFYAAYRIGFGRIYHLSTVTNINTMLTALEQWQELFTETQLLEQMSYIGATVHHETGSTYGTYKEQRQVSTDTARRKEVRRLQDRYWNTGYYGRGPVQLTWAYNYSAMEKATGRPLLNDPDLLLSDLPLGYEVCLKGVLLGIFTGKRLDVYINNTKIDYVNARKTVNGLDCAEKIAKYASKFYEIFKQSVVL